MAVINMNGTSERGPALVKALSSAVSEQYANLRTRAVSHTHTRLSEFSHNFDALTQHVHILPISPWRPPGREARGVHTVLSAVHNFLKTTTCLCQQSLKAGLLTTERRNSGADLFSRRLWELISFPNFVERFFLKLPLSKLCTVPFALQNRALCEGEARVTSDKLPRKGEEEVWPAKGAEREKRTRENKPGNSD